MNFCLLDNMCTFSLGPDVMIEEEDDVDIKNICFVYWQNIKPWVLFNRGCQKILKSGYIDHSDSRDS